MKVNVVYIGENIQIIKELELIAPCNVRQAIEQSGILRECPELNLSVNKVGIFSKWVSMETNLHENDRIEIYRPLKIDPKEARRLRSRKPK